MLSVRLVREDTARLIHKVPQINSLTISTSWSWLFNLVLLPKGGGGGALLFGQGQGCASEQGMVFRFLSLKHSYTISLFKVLK